MLDKTAEHVKPALENLILQSRTKSNGKNFISPPPYINVEEGRWSE